jgi:beta-glucosidase
LRAEGDAAQRRARVILENARGAIPVKSGARGFLHGIDAAAARERGLAPVERLDEAEVAVLKVVAPSELEHPNHFFGRRQHEGRLDFRDGDADYEQIKSAAARVPTIVFVYLDRPAILTNVREEAAALVGTFGASDAALLDVATGRARAEGQLPFALPRSMSDVVAQSPGRPHDLPNPLYPFGWPR